MDIRKQVFSLLRKMRITRIQYITYNIMFLIFSLSSIIILLIDYIKINYSKCLLITIPVMFLFLILSFIMFFKLRIQDKKLKILRNELLKN